MEDHFWEQFIIVLTVVFTHPHRNLLYGHAHRANLSVMIAGGAARVHTDSARAFGAGGVHMQPHAPLKSTLMSPGTMVEACARAPRCYHARTLSSGHACPAQARWDGQRAEEDFTLHDSSRSSPSPSSSLVPTTCPRSSSSELSSSLELSPSLELSSLLLAPLTQPALAARPRLAGAARRVAAASSASAAAAVAPAVLCASLARSAHGVQLCKPRCTDAVDLWQVAGAEGGKLGACGALGRRCDFHGFRRADGNAWHHG